MPIAAARAPDPLRWLGVPMLACILATVVFATPIRFFNLPLPEPVFAMAPVFAWALIRPSFLGPFAILALGSFLDFFWGGSLGMWGLSLLAGYAAVVWTRPMIIGQPFPVMWAWYFGMIAVVMLVAFIVTELRTSSMPSFIAMGWQMLATLALFPIAHRFIEAFEDGDRLFR
jgi:rod shape-determining protein MreD